jgi:hypothetical protein
MELVSYTHACTLQNQPSENIQPAKRGSLNHWQFSEANTC